MNLTYSTRVMCCKGLGGMACDGFVECVGLVGGLRDFLPADGQMGNKGNDEFHELTG